MFALFSVYGTIIIRPFGEQLHATKPNEGLYMDILSMPDSQNYKYILVLKDDLCGYAEFVPSSAATTEVVMTAFSYWIMRFGVVKQWGGSDQGTYSCIMVY